MNKYTRQEAIDYLVRCNIFDEEDINAHEKGTEFYIKYLMEGFDIGIDNWGKINSELWCNKKYWDDYECGIEILELNYEDKELLQNVCKDLKLDVNFDKWRTKEIEHYEYY